MHPDDTDVPRQQLKSTKPSLLERLSKLEEENQVLRKRVSILDERFSRFINRICSDVGLSYPEEPQTTGY